MQLNHVTRRLSAYCHGELTPAEAKRVAEHLLRCPACRGEYEEVRFGIALASKLGRVEAPSDLWAGVENVIDDARRPQVGAPRSVGTSSPPGRRRMLETAAMIASLAAAACLAFVAIERPILDPDAGVPPPSLVVQAVSGAPTVDARPLVATGRLPKGSWLVTDAGARAEIELEDIGEVYVEPNSRVRLLETHADEQRLELARGRVSALVFAPPRLFFIETPSATAVDLGCAYTLEVDDSGASVLHVTAGWVALAHEGAEIEVPSGALCRTAKGRGPGTPYFEDSSEPFRAAVDLFDTTSDPRALRVILREARVRDSLTLWNLLPRTDPAQRVAVFEVLAKLVKPPDGVTRAKVEALDADALDSWYEWIEYSWY